MKHGNLFEQIPSRLDAELFATLLQNSQVKIERIVSRGHTSPESGWYDQDKNEWVLLLSGEASIAFEHDETIHLVTGSYLHITAHTRHKVIRTHQQEDTIWLAVHY